jgi:hypothetical protein
MQKHIRPQTLSFCDQQNDEVRLTSTQLGRSKFPSNTTTCITIRAVLSAVRSVATRPAAVLLRACPSANHRFLHRSDFAARDLGRMSSTIESMKERMAALGGQIRAIKQGGATSSSGEGSLESIQAELKDLKIKMAKAEKEQKAELEKNKVTLKVPKVCYCACYASL